MSGNHIYRKQRTTKSTKHLENLTSLRNIQIGFVRSAADPQRMGRLQVWIPEFGPDIEGSWVTVSYASPFAGVTNIADEIVDDHTENGSQKSYGFWAVPPDVGNQVLVCFVNGDSSRGYWFGCVYAQNMNHMVPGIGMNTSTDDNMNQAFSPFYPPVVEYNKKDSEVNPKAPKRPVRSAMAEALLRQGLQHDGERGVTNTSARREDTSMVQGWLTPGGSSISFDDDPSNSFIRFRTKSGTQLMISETSGYIYMITKGGNSWVEISDGAIEMYSSAPISLRSQDDVNIRADGDLNLDAGGNVNVHAGGNFRTFSGGSTALAAGGSFAAQASGKMSLSGGGDVGIGGGGNVGISAGSNLVAESGGNNVRNGAQILDNSGGGGAVAPDDAQFKESSSIGGGPSTICSRLPSHEPYNHPINATTNPSGDFGETMNGTIKSSDGTITTGDITPDNTPVQSIAGFKVSDKVNGCIYAAASRTGVPYATLMAICAQESRFKAGAGASTSSAKGLFQFTNGTWKQTYNRYGPNGSVVKNAGVKNDVYDPCSNALMGAYYCKENMAELSRAGLPTGPNEIYAMHFLGPAGGKKFLRAVKTNPTSPASSSVASNQISANKSVFYTGGRMRTNKEVYNWINSKVGGTVPQWQDYQKKNS